jgi:hypothetical protein
MCAWCLSSRLLATGTYFKKKESKILSRHFDGSVTDLGLYSQVLYTACLFQCYSGHVVLFMSDDHALCLHERSTVQNNSLFQTKSEAQVCLFKRDGQDSFTMYLYVYV